MKTIVCVSHVVPWPGAHGNEIRLQRLLVWLRSHDFRIILVLTASDVEPDQQELVRRHVDRLEMPCQTTRQLDPKQFLRRFRMRFEQMRSWVAAGGAPPEPKPMQKLADLICPDSVGRLVNRVVAEEAVDVFYAYYAFTLQAFRDVPRRESIICDTVELFSMVHYDAAGAAIDNVLTFTREEERSMLLTCGHILAIQRAEAEDLVELVPERRVWTVGMDYDVPAFPGLPSESAELVGIVGSANQANIDGLRLFLDQCWPLVRALAPGARLRVAGQLGTAARRWYSDAPPDGVEMIGWVEDMAEFYRGLRVVVNPVRAGTGLKIKTIEALAHCRPIVTYPIGCEGIDPAAEQAWWVVEDATSMAEACASLLQNPTRCDAMALAARKFASAALTADSVYAPLSRVIDTIVTGRG
jgi:glycosyltransferase involved in cell wall biosynthesis